VPSLNIESSFGRAFPRFYIRGYGNTDFRLNASQPVSLVYDDVVQENPILKGFPAFDLERIEVLRGPQGTLFGRNTPAGVVKFDSVKPDKKLEGYASLAVGDRGTTNLEGAINVPLARCLGTRVGARPAPRRLGQEHRSSGLTQDFEGYRDSAVRAQLLVEPARTSARCSTCIRATWTARRGCSAPTSSSPAATTWSTASTRQGSRSTARTNQKLKISGANMRLRFGLGDMTLYSITGYESPTPSAAATSTAASARSFLPARARA
jgi:iron complex outermembrane receptor protein